MRSATILSKPTGALRPVPTAVPPWASCISLGRVCLDALDAVGDLLGIAGKFLAQGERRGVLGMGAADLDDVLPGLGLVVQRVVQMLQRRDQPVLDLLRAGDVHGGGIGVVGRLAHIDVIVGMDRLLASPSPRPASRWRGWRSPHWRSCWTGCPSRSARPPAGNDRPACRRSLPGRRRRWPRRSSCPAGPAPCWSRRRRA